MVILLDEVRDIKATHSNFSATEKAEVGLSSSSLIFIGRNTFQLNDDSNYLCGHVFANKTTPNQNRGGFCCEGKEKLMIIGRR